MAQMMAAYQPQPGTMPPGMAPHAHPGMAQGQPMNPVQMQMAHHGAVTPGPHVTQAGAMMGMQPGANGMGGPAGMTAQHPGGQMGGIPGPMGGQSMAGGVPNAHALSQMNPAVMQQQQLMAQHLQANPQLAMQQQQQQAAIMQRRAMAGMPQGMQGLTAQQMLQHGNAMHPQGLQLPQHLHAQMQARMQQQQAAQNQQLQMQQQALQQQQQQAQQQQQQQAQQQQQQAQQQAQQQQQQQAQNNNQGAQPAAQNQPGGQPQQQQHPAGQPMRPQSRMANANEQNQSGPQQGAQGQQAAQQGQTPQQQQAQQAPNNPQQGPQQTPQQPGQPQQFTQQQMQMQALRQRQLQQMQQQQNLQRQLQAQQVQQQAGGQGGGIFLLKVMNFGDHLSSFDVVTGKDIALWHNFVERNFAPDARLMHSFAPSAAQEEQRLKRYEVPRATIARYFHMYFESNAAYIRLHLEQGRETPMHPGRHQVSFASAILTVAYPNGARLEMKGTFNVLFAPGSDSIELMELYTHSTEEHVTRSEIEKVLSNWSPTMGNKTSPKIAKNKLPKAQQKVQSQNEGLTIDHFPRISTGKLGVHERVQQFLEIDETMNVMADLIAIAQENKMRPEQALEAAIARYESQGGPNAMQQGNPQINLPPNGVAVGNRTPGMQHMQMPNVQGGNQFSSPSVSNLNLPMQNGIAGMNGSPHIANNAGLAPNLNMPNSHTPSPHQSNMAAPAMMPQHSQQGTNSSTASANTSPNVNNNNKRRRSTVKMEGDDGASDAGALNRAKTTPTMRKNRKP